MARTFSTFQILKFSFLAANFNYLFIAFLITNVMAPFTGFATYSIDTPWLWLAIGVAAVAAVIMKQVPEYLRSLGPQAVWMASELPALVGLTAFLMAGNWWMLGTGVLISVFLIATTTEL